LGAPHRIDVEWINGEIDACAHPDPMPPIQLDHHRN